MNNHFNENIPDLGGLSKPDARAVLRQAREKMGDKTNAAIVIWLTPTGQISWTGNVDLNTQHLMGSLISAAAMKVMLGG